MVARIVLVLAMDEGRHRGLGRSGRPISQSATKLRVRRHHLVGGGTARRDDPLLTASARGGRAARRVILTTRPGSLRRNRIFREGTGEVLVACPAGIPRREAERLRALGARVLPLPSRGGRIRAADLLGALGAEGVTSLLVEGGGRTAGWLAAEGAVDRYVQFVAPLLLGEGVRSLSGWACPDPRSGVWLSFEAVRRVGKDILLIAEPRDGR